MKTGFKRIDITLPISIPICGNSRVDTVSKGIYDNLYADVLIQGDDWKV
jgi:hypothetical protein